MCCWRIKSKADSQEKAARTEHFELLKEMMASLCKADGVGMIKSEILVKQAHDEREGERLMIERD